MSCLVIGKTKSNYNTAVNDAATAELGAINTEVVVLYPAVSVGVNRVLVGYVGLRLKLVLKLGSRFRVWLLCANLPPLGCLWAIIAALFIAKHSAANNNYTTKLASQGP